GRVRHAPCLAAPGGVVAPLLGRLPGHGIADRAAAQVELQPQQPLPPADPDGTGTVLGPELLGDDRGVLELEHGPALAGVAEADLELRQIVWSAGLAVDPGDLEPVGPVA